MSSATIQTMFGRFGESAGSGAAANKRARRVNSRMGLSRCTRRCQSRRWPESAKPEQAADRILLERGTMRIWMHLLLSAVAVFAGFFAGPCWPRRAGVDPRRAPVGGHPGDMRVAGCFRIGGLRTGDWLVRQLPARCPRVLGRPMRRGTGRSGSVVTACGHVHRTNVRANWGAD